MDKSRYLVWINLNIWIGQIQIFGLDKSKDLVWINLNIWFGYKSKFSAINHVFRRRGIFQITNGLMSDDILQNCINLVSRVFFSKMVKEILHRIICK